MALYYCNETDTVVTTESIRKDFEQFQLDGSYTDLTFREYLNGCMWYNNGALTPLRDYISHLRQELNRIVSYGYPENDEWITNLTEQIDDLTTYLKTTKGE